MTAPPARLPAPPVLTPGPGPPHEARPRPGPQSNHQSRRATLLRPLHALGPKAGRAPRGRSGRWVPGAAVRAVTLNPAPSFPPVQSWLLARAGAWPWGQALSGRGCTPPPAYEVTSLPVCARGVLPPRDGGSEELAVAGRSVRVQVPLRPCRRAGREAGRPRTGCGSRGRGSGLAGARFPPLLCGPRCPRSEDVPPLPGPEAPAPSAGPGIHGFSIILEITATSRTLRLSPWVDELPLARWSP